MKDAIQFRKIQQKDNESIAKIIRQSLEEYGEDKPGTVYTDPTTDDLFAVFNATEKSRYFIATVNNKVIGGSGIFPTKGLPDGYAELVKIYLNKDYRGLGVGGKLMQKSIAFAQESGFTHLYIESIPSLKEAINLYEKFDFKPLKKQLGDSGHFACNVWMVKEL